MWVCGGVPDFMGDELSIEKCSGRQLDRLLGRCRWLEEGKNLRRGEDLSREFSHATFEQIMHAM